MSERIPFQYAVLHYLHDVVTGEFLNVGLVIYSKPHKYFRAELLTKYSRITHTFPGADGEFYRRYIVHLQSKLNKLSNQIMTEQSSYWDRWPDRIEHLLNTVLPVDDSSIQFGEPQGGLAADLDSVFEDMYNRLVEHYLEAPEKISRTDEEVWSQYSIPLRENNLLGQLQSKIISTPNDVIEFDHAWKNGRWNLLQPLSFDLVIPTTIRRKARTWLGTTLILKNNDEWSHLYYLLGKPRSDHIKLEKAYDNAKDILTTDIDGLPISLIEENEAVDFVNEIKPRIESRTNHINEGQ